jgi:hypothetical protein
MAAFQSPRRLGASAGFDPRKIQAIRGTGPKLLKVSRVVVKMRIMFRLSIPEGKPTGSDSFDPKAIRCQLNPLFDSFLSADPFLPPISQPEPAHASH